MPNKPARSRRFEISVWNNSNGDLVRKTWDATEADLDEIEEFYLDEPFMVIVIDREWEAAGDDDD